MRRARVHTFELRSRDGELLAGEAGCVGGGGYTSFTGYSTESGTGTAQLALTGQLLERLGFAFWDLGQDIAYKLKLGARLIPRKEFVARVAAARDAAPERSLSQAAAALHTKLDQEKPVAVAAAGAAAKVKEEKLRLSE